VAGSGRATSIRSCAASRRTFASTRPSEEGDLGVRLPIVLLTMMVTLVVILLVLRDPAVPELLRGLGAELPSRRGCCCPCLGRPVEFPLIALGLGMLGLAALYWLRRKAPGALTGRCCACPTSAGSCGCTRPASSCGRSRRSSGGLPLLNADRGAAASIATGDGAGGRHGHGADPGGATSPSPSSPPGCSSRCPEMVKVGSRRAPSGTC